MRGMTRGQLAALVVVTLALVPSACTEERKLGAEEFVTDVNEQGVALTLGEPLHTEDENKELYAIELEPIEAGQTAGGEDEHEGKDEHGHEHAGGSLAVHDDNASAEEGLSACQASADLLCYRAANIVIVLEGGGLEGQRLGAAMQNLADE
jgi:hypothetical protein